MTFKFQTPKQNQPLKHKSFANTYQLSANFHKYHQPSNKPKTLQFQIKTNIPNNRYTPQYHIRTNVRSSQQTHN